MHQSDWAPLLPFAEFTHNSHSHITLEHTPITPFISKCLDFLSCLWTTFPSYKLAPQHHGHFKITSIIQDTSCRLEPPPSWKIHPVFHASLLSSYCETSTHGSN